VRDALIELDPARGDLVGQLTAGLKAAIRTGKLPPQTRLPSTRALAGDLGVSRGVAVEAYEQLVAEGFLVSRHGSGTRVARGAAAGGRGGPAAGPAGDAGTAAAPAGSGTGADAGQPRYDMRPGTPDLSAFPRSVWLAALRHTLATVPHTALGYADPAGVPALRAELAGYLGRVRGTDATAAQIVAVGGVAEGLALVTRVLAGTGHRVLAVEDPSAIATRELLTGSGLDLVGVPVDSHGIQVGALAATGARAVLLTPAHQFPTGVVLSPDRRAALADWAREADAVVVEDDYDAEFRYDREPVGCLQGLAPDRVVHLGSVSKSLAPGLRLGWAVLPTFLVAAVRAAKHQADYCSPVIDQYALAYLLDSGRYDRHLRGVRRRYRARRDALVGALAERLPDVRVHGVAAGLHVCVELPGGCDEAAVAEAARGRGLAVVPVGDMRLAGRDEDHPPALVLGYANVPEPRLVEAAALLAAAVAAGRTGGTGRDQRLSRSGRDA
jgi:DNA-binding transcriptional MocR family regulator